MAKRKVTKAMERKLQRNLNALSILTLDICRARYRQSSVATAIRCSDSLDAEVQRFGAKLRRKLGLPKGEKY